MLKLLRKEEYKPSEGIRQLRKDIETMEFAQISKSFGRMLELDVAPGIGHAVGLMKEDKIAVAKTKISPGSIFRKHSHNEWEMLLVYDGEIEIHLEGKIIKLKPMQSYYLLPKTPHAVTTEVGAELLSITIPGSVDWPEGGEGV